jgi:hypothetical protein
MRLLKQSALSAVFMTGLCQVAVADPIAFQWSPSSVGLTASAGITATSMSLVHYADITISTTTGAFTENGVFAISGFQNSGTAVSSGGLNSTYNLFVTFQDTGYQFGFPTPGSPASGVFTSLSYTVWGSNAAAIAVQLQSGGAPTITSQGQAIPLYYGSLIDGTLSLALDASGNLVPGANVNATVIPCVAGATTTTGNACAGNEAGLFLTPTTGIAMAIQDLSGAGVSTFSYPNSNQAYLDINGGTIGDISFYSTQGQGSSNSPALAPEPGTLALMVSGLLALGAVGSRSRQKANPIRR